MASGFVGTSIAIGDNTYNTAVDGATVNYTCPSDKKYAVITANYSVNPHVSLNSGSTVRTSAIVTNIVYASGVSNSTSGVADSNKISLAGTATFIVGPGQSWSTKASVSSSAAYMDASVTAHVHVSVVEIT